MSTTARRRLLHDLKKLQNDSPAGINAAPSSTDNVMEWQAVIFGPDDTVWEGGTFKLTITFTEEYPHKPPEVRFVSEMFHPNSKPLVLVWPQCRIPSCYGICAAVYKDGRICLDILQNKWSPIYDVIAILQSIQSMLSDPNTGSPADSEAAKLYDKNRKEYDRRVKQIVEKSWLSLDDYIDEQDIADEEDDAETSDSEYCT